eukprot:984277-Amphidinium_carterae.1
MSCPLALLLRSLPFLDRMCSGVDLLVDLDSWALMVEWLVMSPIVGCNKRDICVVDHFWRSAHREQGCCAESPCLACCGAVEMFCIDGASPRWFGVCVISIVQTVIFHNWEVRLEPIWADVVRNSFKRGSYYVKLGRDLSRCKTERRIVTMS